MSEGITFTKLEEIPDRGDMDVVIDGQRFVSEAKAREQIDALNHALAKQYTENHTILGKLDDIEIERDAAQKELADVKDTLARVREAVGFGPEPLAFRSRIEPITLETETGKKIDFTPTDYTIHPDEIDWDNATVIDPYDEPQFHDEIPIPPAKKKWYRRPWLAFMWVGIAGLVAGSAATTYNSDTPTVVETVENVSPGFTHEDAEQNLTWAPSEGAASYRVVIFRGGSPVRDLTVTEAAVTVDLPPGSYQWVVYPLVAGSQGDAIVNSVLTVEATT